MLGATATVREKKPIPFCAHDQQLWTCASSSPHQTPTRQAVASDPIRMLAKRALSQTATSNRKPATRAIKLSCAHSWWSRQSQYCPVTSFRDAGMPLLDRCTHFHIPIWPAFRGNNRTICEIGRFEYVGGEKNPTFACRASRDRVRSAISAWMVPCDHQLHSTEHLIDGNSLN